MMMRHATISRLSPGLMGRCAALPVVSGPCRDALLACFLYQHLNGLSGTSWRVLMSNISTIFLLIVLVDGGQHDADMCLHIPHSATDPVACMCVQ